MIEVKKAIAEIITMILRVSVNVQQFKSLLRIVRFNYHELYLHFFEKFVSEKVRQEFIHEMVDIGSYGNSIKCIFNTIQRVLSE